MICAGKSNGNPKHGCPFCSASSPYLSNGDLYTLGDLFTLHKVYVFICSISINILFKDFVDNVANLRQQKNFQNVVNSPLLTGDESTKVIEIISVPELHLLLGRLPYKVYIHIFYSGIVAKFIKEIQAKVFMCKNSGKKLIYRFLKKVLFII